MSALAALGDYGGSSSEDESAAPVAVAAAGSKAAGGQMRKSAAPAVNPKATEGQSMVAHINMHSQELSFNPKYQDLYAPSAGPQPKGAAAAGTAQPIKRNTWTGYIEPGNINEFQFEDQRRTMHNLGFAIDPSSSQLHLNGPAFIGDQAAAAAHKGDTLVHTSVKKAKRKRKKGGAADSDSYLGPWAPYEDEKTEAKPTEEEMVVLEEYAKIREAQKAAKRAGRQAEQGEKRDIEGGDEDETAAKRALVREEETTVLHLPDAMDYQGRSFMEPPRSEGVRFGEPPERCFVPKKLLHTWSGHTKGVSAIRFMPPSAYFLLLAGMDSKIKLWEVYGERRVVRTYLGSQQAVRDIAFNNDGTRFVSCGYDKVCRLWDTETGKCLNHFTNNKMPYCVKFNPAEDKQHLFCVGTQDKKILTYDCNSGETVQEYDRHLGPVNTITFVEQGRKMVTTSDDKSLRVWEWDIPVDIKYIADPSMHSMPSVALHPNEKWLCAQSMDNQIVTFSCGDRFKPNRKKVFKGHLAAGYACQVNFSPDGTYVVSGDAHGNCFIWDWKSRRIQHKIRAHDKVCIGVEWNPNEAAKMATCGWDGLIKYWG